MTVEKLIEKLKTLDPKLKVYLSDNDLDEDTYYYQALNVYKINVEDEDLVTIVYRR